MPNHVTNKVEIAGPKETIQAIKDQLITETSKFDFETIIPTPDGLKDTTAPFRGTEEESETLIKSYGYDNWYSWRCDNWGTKWNAYEVYWEDEIHPVGSTYITGVQFDTAWSTPAPIIEALAKAYPDVTIRVCYADEDIGSNFGEYMFALDALPVFFIRYEHEDLETCEAARQTLFALQPIAEEAWDSKTGKFDWDGFFDADSE
jgi:hypothetical protein